METEGERDRGRDRGREKKGLFFMFGERTLKLAIIWNDGFQGDPVLPASRMHL